jgi:hypothetical protein
MKNTFWLFILLIFLGITAQGQRGVGGLTDRFRNMGSGGGAAGNIEKRKSQEDSITITYRYLDTARNYKLDSSLHDFTQEFPIPATHYHLGNTGSATQSYLFSPLMNAGLDVGLHAFDVYKFTPEKTRFFTTTRPFSEINYMLSSKGEQFIELMHTQNRKPNWNIQFDYRFISAPGSFSNQKTSHNNYLVTNWFQSVNKRYNNFFVLIANKLQSTESGGIDESQDYLNNKEFEQRLYIPTKIGGSNTEAYGGNFFNTSIKQGNKYSDLTVLMRQHYDVGKKDSLVLDTTVVPLFFPRVRFEHTIAYKTNKYIYFDPAANVNAYLNYFGVSIPSADLDLKDSWRELYNDFSLYTFPDAKNTQQFLKAGLSVQNLKAVFDTNSKKDYVNIFAQGEYRNRTKNKKWDIIASGKLYFAGLNAGDYEAKGSIESLLGRKIGALQLGVENVNKSPVYITNPLSNFYLMNDTVHLKKENLTHIYANIYQPILKLGLSGHYYLVTNYIYFSDYYVINQTSTVFNVLQVAANKIFEFGRKKQWKWRAEAYFQQTIGNAPVNLPLVFTRNRFGYEGNLGYRRLNIAMGLEGKYASPYKANRYSPMLGQFFINDSTVRYKLPDIAAYVHFRIGSLKTFIRAENLNSFGRLGNKYGFFNNNILVPGYPYPGLMIRVGIFWGFVN